MFPGVFIVLTFLLSALAVSSLMYGVTSYGTSRLNRALALFATLGFTILSIKSVIHFEAYEDIYSPVVIEKLEANWPGYEVTNIAWSPSPKEVVTRLEDGSEKSLRCVAAYERRDSGFYNAKSIIVQVEECYMVEVKDQYKRDEGSIIDAPERDS